MASRTVGHYRLLSLIGKGATSEVYAAEHGLLGDKVAVKLLRPEHASDPGQTQALVEEGARVRGIDHVNVVRVIDVGIDSATAGCYLVMERVTGETLAARLNARGALPEAEVRRLGAEIADGVAAAHAKGIVHRDLKPANIMLAGDRPKIVDFGIAKHLGARSAITTGRMVGTLAYMAPEQLASGMIAPCTDLWALGVILFELATGEHPFENFDDGRCPQLFDEPRRASAIADVSPALDAIIARCLARDPARRPASAAELARLLRGEAVLDDERLTVDAGPIVAPLVPPPLGPSPTGAPRSIAGAAPITATRPRRASVRVAAIALACAVVVFVVAVTRSSSESSRAAPPPPPDAARAVVEPPPAPPPSDAAAVDPAAIEIVEAPTVETIQQVHVTSVPRGAEVLIAGVRRGTTPLTLGLTFGERITVRRAGYQPTVARFERPGPIEVTLRKKKRAPARQPKKETIW